MEHHALNIVKYHNILYHYIIIVQVFLKWFYTTNLQFEINCLKLCLLDEKVSITNNHSHDNFNVNIHC
jgi:hypothetical protein